MWGGCGGGELSYDFMRINTSGFIPNGDKPNNEDVQCCGVYYTGSVHVLHVLNLVGVGDKATNSYIMTYAYGYYTYKKGNNSKNSCCI